MNVLWDVVAGLRFGESGQAYVVETEFRNVGTYPVHPYPHPDRRLCRLARVGTQCGGRLLDSTQP